MEPCNDLREDHVGIETASVKNIARLVFGGRCDGFDVLTTVFAFEEHFVFRGRETLLSKQIGRKFSSKSCNKALLILCKKKITILILKVFNFISLRKELYKPKSSRAFSFSSSASLCYDFYSQQIHKNTLIIK